MVLGVLGLRVFSGFQCRGVLGVLGAFRVLGALAYFKVLFRGLGALGFFRVREL